ncbi:MAG: hypothetical protein KUG77_29995 [Nannocystaceae bacterium]|nr:hypothetical protein [Nannocystaceae bacterium]
MMWGRGMLLSLLCVGACAKAAGPRGTTAPEAASAPGLAFGMDDNVSEEAAGGDRGYVSENPSFDELEARFEQLDADLSAQGISATEDTPMAATVTLDPPSTASPAKKRDLVTRCERICSLKGAICDVSERICGLAESHEGEEKYIEACTRSESRCEQATTACSTCAG